MKRIIDLTTAIENGLPSDPPFMIPKIDYRSHEDSVEEMLRMFPGAKKEDLPNGLAWANDYVTLCVHAGTHLDAPWHYHPTMNNGERAWTIDEVPLEWCIGNGVVIDMSEKPDGYATTIKDFEEKLAAMNYKLQPGDIVLVRTGAQKHWGTQKYLTAGCGMGREVTLWILSHGVNVVGTDGWSWDRPLGFMAEDFQKTGDKSVIWEGHFAGIERGYCHIEKLANLDQLPSTGFQFICLPIKIKGASAGWIRAVGIVEE
ncbi:MAG: cyclase family protein [Bacillota bacterium]|nr:cyclase family protein [Bacillota bacterium]